MVILIFSTIFVIYSFLGAIAYIPSFKSSPYYYWVGLFCALITNFLWLYLTKHTQDLKLINKYAYIWDGIIMITAAIIPILFFGIIPKGMHFLGISLIILGIILLKL